MNPWDLHHLDTTVGRYGPDPTVVLDPAGRIRFVNQAITRVFGFQSEELLDDEMWNFVHPDDLESAAGALAESSRTDGYHYPHPCRVRHRDGTWVPCEVNGFTHHFDDGQWTIIGMRAASDRDHSILRRTRIEQLIRSASLECAAARGNEVLTLVDFYLEDLARIVNAKSIELAWVDADPELRIGASWPPMRSNPQEFEQSEPFVSLWDEPVGANPVLHFSKDLTELRPSETLESFLDLGAHAVVELPLADRAPFAVLRIALGENWQSWDDANADLVSLLASILISTIRRCAAEEHLRQQARTDQLTGLLNRSALYRHLEVLMKQRAKTRRRSQANPRELGLIYADLDLFKDVNDQLGHAAGDDLLIEVAKVMNASVRDVDIVARVGGDEFVIVCPNLDSHHTLVAIMDRIAKGVVPLGTPEIPIQVSMGATLATDDQTVDDLVRVADELMYEHKRQRHRERKKVELEHGQQHVTPSQFSAFDLVDKLRTNS